MWRIHDDECFVGLSDKFRKLKILHCHFQPLQSDSMQQLIVWQTEVFCLANCVAVYPVVHSLLSECLANCVAVYPVLHSLLPECLQWLEERPV
jgi:hypothetical protein